MVQLRQLDQQLPIFGVLGTHLGQEIDRLAQLLGLCQCRHIGLLMGLVSRCYAEDFLIERQGLLMPVHLQQEASQAFFQSHPLCIRFNELGVKVA